MMSYVFCVQPKMRAGAVKALEKMLRGAGVHPVETRLAIEGADESIRSDQVNATAIGSTNMCRVVVCVVCVVSCRVELLYVLWCGVVLYVLYVLW